MGDNGVVRHAPAPARTPRAGAGVAATVLRRHAEGLRRALLTTELALADLDPDALRAGDPPDDPLRLLFEERPDVAREIRGRVLGPVLGEDRERARRLLETLAAWVAAGGSAADAAAALFCHRNTVLARLHTVEDLIGRSLVNMNAGPRFGDLFEIMLALRAHEYLEGA